MWIIVYIASFMTGLKIRGLKIRGLTTRATQYLLVLEVHVSAECTAVYTPALLMHCDISTHVLVFGLAGRRSNNR
jgi:hypothetical protein